MPEIKKQKKLNKFMNKIVEKKDGYSIGDPWKFSEESLLVVVPILRTKETERMYVTMYEVLKELDIKDTGKISEVELQNKVGKPIFVRAGTIFSGKTQNRATQHSGVYKDVDVTLNVRCVHQTHGISTGAKMEYGSLAPLSVTMNLMQGSQRDVWDSVSHYTSGSRDPFTPSDVYGTTGSNGTSGYSGWSGISGCIGSSGRSRSDNITYTASCASMNIETSPTSSNYIRLDETPRGAKSDDLLGYLKGEGKKALDEMMQKVPLFDNQVGAIVFNPTGVLAVETFDHKKSWEAIKAEIIEKYGDKVSDEQAEHLFELNKDMILPMLKKFIAKLDNAEEKMIREDSFSTTLSIKGDKIYGEYTMVGEDVIHCLLVKE